ncbi:hypothetical protein J6590_049674 [Homalodisca vitripennis]|nr:hypothetical protein J6590_049674 [Homalodisca vitripennis]
MEWYWCGFYRLHVLLLCYPKEFHSGSKAAAQPQDSGDAAAVSGVSWLQSPLKDCLSSVPSKDRKLISAQSRTVNPLTSSNCVTKSQQLRLWSMG